MDECWMSCRSSSPTTLERIVVYRLSLPSSRCS
jgi:hypothetical protein